MLTGAPVQSYQLKMFGRLNNFGEQALIVGLRIEPKGDGTVALVLPLPVRPGGRCVVVDIGGYEDMFIDFDKCWEPSLVLSDVSHLQAELDGVSMTAGLSASGGEVYASRADLGRLEAPLRPPASVIGNYADSAFAVFRLPPGETKVRPLALVFESAVPNKIFFPLLTEWRGAVPEKMRMEHRLYAQAWTGKKLEGWFDSDVRAVEHIDLKRAQGLVRGELFIHRLELRGERKNEDIWVPVT